MREEAGLVAACLTSAALCGPLPGPEVPGLLG